MLAHCQSEETLLQTTLDRHGASGAFLLPLEHLAAAVKEWADCHIALHGARVPWVARDGMGQRAVHRGVAADADVAGSFAGVDDAASDAGRG